MDYDRALYRVYERIMEELNASPSPLALASSDRHEIHHRNVRLGGGRRDIMDTHGIASTGATATGGGVDSSAAHAHAHAHAHADNDGDGDDQPYNDVGDSIEGANRPTSVRIPPSIARRRVSYSTVRMQQRHRRQQQQHQPLPFLFPIWMSRKIDLLVEHNRLHRHPMLNFTDHSSTSYVAYLWSKIQGWMDLIGNLGSGHRHTTYTSVASSAPISNSSSSIMSPTPTSITNINLQVADEEMGEIPSVLRRQEEIPNPPPLSSNNGDQSPSSSSSPGSDGLRRRSNSRQVSGGGLQQQNNDDITSLSSIANRWEGGSADVPPLSMSHPSMSSQRRGEQDEHSVSQYQRREGGSRSGRSSSSSSNSTSNSSEYLRSNDSTTTSSSNESTSSSSSDDSITARNSQLDDDNNGPIDRVGSINDHNYDERGGCSQLNVYIAMRLSFAIAVFHIFVLISLHSTYVGPYAFRGRHINMKQQYGHVSRKQRRQQDETTATDSTFVNCIAYALSTRPIKDRSSYFGGSDEDVPSDGNDTVERLLAYETDTDLAEHEWSNLWDRGVAGIENKTNSDTITTEDEFHPLLGKDEILQIKILYGNSCVGQCSRVRTVDYPVQLYPNSSDNYTDGDTPGFQARMLTQVDRLLNASQIDHNTTSEDELSSPSYWEKIHYRFSLDDALLHLDETSSFMHNITLVNVTVTERCLSSGSDNGE